jgi:hypothetical protein
MIKVSPKFTSLASSNQKSFAFCVQVDTYRSTTFYRDIILSSGETFIADGRAVQVSPPKVDSIVDRQEMSIILNSSVLNDLGLSFDLLIGKRLALYQVAIDPVTNLPETNTADILVITRNFISSVSVQYDTAERGESNIEVKGSSPLLDLSLKKKYYASKEYIQQFAPLDTAYDQIYVGSRLINLKWGKT